MKELTERVLCIVLLVCILLAFFVKGVLHAQERVLVLGVKPTKCNPPCQIMIRAIARPNPDNDKIVLVWANVLENDTNNGTRQYFDNIADMTITDVPQGYYTIQAILYRKGKVVAEMDIFVAVGVDPPGRAAVRFGLKAPP